MRQGGLYFLIWFFKLLSARRLAPENQSRPKLAFQ